MVVIGTRWVDPLEIAYAPTWTNTVQLPPSLCPALQIDERFTGEAQSRVPQHTQCVCVCMCGAAAPQQRGSEKLRPGAPVPAWVTSRCNA